MPDGADEKTNGLRAGIADPADLAEIERPPNATSPHGTFRTGLAADGWLRWVAVDTTAVAEDARGRLDLSPVAAAALGQALSGAALLLKLALEVPVRISLDVRGDGPLRRVLAEAERDGGLRGLVGEPQLDFAHAEEGDGIAVGAALGAGALRVVRDIEGKGTYESQVALGVGGVGDVGNALAHYLEQSEQTRSAVLLGVLLKPYGVAASGGVIVEAFPGVPDETIERLEANIADAAGLSRRLDEGGLDRVLDELFFGFDVETLESGALEYRCRCDRGRLIEVLSQLPREERATLFEEHGEIVADCAYCAAQYRFREDDFEVPN